MKISYLLLTCCSLAALTACGGSSVKETLGIGRKAPDEFRVVSRPPLSVPPEFSLRPPSMNAESPTVVPADKQAQSILTGTPVATSSDGNSFDLRESSVDTAVAPVSSENLPLPGKTGSKQTASASNSGSGFMKNIGVDEADPNVRQTLVEQRIAKQEQQEEASWWDVFSSKPEKKDPLVNAKAEAERIKKNEQENKPVTEGETPQIKDKDRGLIGDIFGW